MAFYNNVGFGGRICGKYIRRGSRLYIEGKIRYRIWEDRNAIKRNVTEIYVDNFELLGGK